MKKLYMIGNTHFDPVWLWTWDEAMASIRATFHSVIERMEEDSEFCYSFSCPPVFEWIEKTEPELFEKIKSLVKEGRWELAEGWWVQPDCFSATGESYARQGLYGQRYLKSTFGRYSEIGFNVDSFGHNHMLPQILSKSRIKYYCFCRPEQPHYPLNSPIFLWKGNDGSTVKAFRIGGGAGEGWSKNLKETMENTEYLCDLLMIYGVTDHGGAPTKKAMAEIHAQKNAVFSTVQNFFENQNNVTDILEGEFITGDFGVYCNHSEVKKLNRAAEYAVMNAEKALVMANNRQENQKTAQCWRDILFNQFHDILGGSSIKEAYTDARNLYGRALETANEITHTNLQYITAKINMPGKNPDNAWNVVVWNLNGFDFDGYIEAELQWAHEFDWYEDGICLEDESGMRYDCQIIREKSVIPGFRSRFVFKAVIPSLGYKAFKAIQTKKPAMITDSSVKDPYFISTDNFEIKLSKDNGSVLSVYDKKNRKNIACDLLVPACYSDEGDTWAFNIDSYGEKTGEFEVESVKITEAGDLRTTVKITSYFKHSKLETYYTFYNKEAYFDVYYRVNWNEKFTVFKLDSSISAKELDVSAPYGSIKRKENKKDTPMGEWINAGKISFISDSVFAYNLNSSKLGLTVLRSPIYGDLRIRDICLEDDYEIMEQGIRDVRIRVVFHEKTHFGERIVETAAAFNNKPIVITESNHGGELKSSGSFCSLYAKSAAITAVKHCEDTDGEIVRLYEYAGTAQKAELILHENKYDININPYEIKTLKIINGKITETDILEEDY